MRHNFKTITHSFPMLNGKELFFYIMFVFCAYHSHENEGTLKEIALIVVCCFCLLMAKIESIHEDIKEKLDNE